MVPEYASNDAIKDKVDCVEIPTFNGKEDNCINGLGYAVFEGSKNKEAAEDFAIWLGSKEAQEIQGKTGVVISARTDAQKYFAELIHSTILQLTQITLMKHIRFRYVRKQQNCMIWKQQNFRKHIMERNHFQMSARV